jgi:putative hydrolase of HD superfamily
MVDWKEVTEFLRIVGELKKLSRSGWLKAGIRPESVADHVFRTALLAMVYGDLKGLDSEKMMRMALLHDLPEIITGDLRPEEKTAKLREEEYAAIEKILSYLPGDLRDRYMKTWAEFEDRTSEEAKLVRELDKLEMAMQALDYQEEGYKKEKLEEFWTNAKANIEDPDLKKIYELLEKRKSYSE